MSPSPSWTEHGARAAVFAVLIGCGSLLAALYFQYVAGYQPCKLCLLQRWPYYLGLPIGLVGLALYALGHTRVATGLMAVFIFTFLIGAGLGAYHSGVEWAFWAGPSDCAGPLSSGPASVEDFRKSLATTKVIRCDEAPLRILGLSFAGWNTIVSLAVAGLASRIFAR